MNTQPSSQTKKILIVCDLFPPAFAPRMGYLCKNLQRLGWSPTVLTESIDENTFSFLTGYCPVTYVSFYTANTKWKHRIEWIHILVKDFLFGYKDRKLLSVAKTLNPHRDFRLVLSSTYRTFPAPAAMKIARYYGIPFVADFRDIIEQYAGNEFIAHTFRTVSIADKLLIRIFKQQNLARRNRVLRHADHITTVSPWHRDLLQIYNPHTTLIYNGYDDDIFYPQQIPTDRFVVSYTGRLLSLQMRDPSLLFEAVSRMKQKGIFPSHQCRIQWYTDPASRTIIGQEAQKYNIAEYMDFFDYVPAHEIPGILNRSSVLLQLTNKSDEKGPKGLMTTKIFESFAVEKPVLCVRSDESFLEQSIREAQAGIAARTVEEVIFFLQQKFAEWQKKGFTTSHANREFIQKYSRKEQAKQFVHIFEDLISLHQTWINT